MANDWDLYLEEEQMTAVGCTLPIYLNFFNRQLCGVKQTIALLKPRRLYST